MGQAEAFAAAKAMSENAVVVKYANASGDTVYYAAASYTEAEDILRKAEASYREYIR